MMIPSPKRVLETWSALIGVMGSSYLELLEELDIELGVLGDDLEWPFLIIGTVGTGSVLLTSWKGARQRSRGMNKAALPRH